MIVYIKIIGGDHKSEGKSIKFNVSPMESVASLKAMYNDNFIFRYVNSGCCPTPTTISLRYNVYIFSNSKGQILQDEKLLKEYEIGEDSVIYHFTYNMSSFASVNYDDLSTKLKKKAKLEGYQKLKLNSRDFFHAGYSADGDSTWDSKWDKGDEWKEFPPNIITGSTHVDQ